MEEQATDIQEDKEEIRIMPTNQQREAIMKATVLSTARVKQILSQKSPEQKSKDRIALDQAIEAKKKTKNRRKEKLARQNRKKNR